MPTQSGTVQITLDDNPLVDPKDLWQWCIRQTPRKDTSRFFGLGNSIWIPRGIEPTRAYFLLTLGTLENLDANTTHTAVVTDSSTNSTVVINGLYLVRATALFPGPDPAGDISTVYLAEFTDCRGFGIMLSEPLTKQFNVRHPEGGFLPDTAKNSSPAKADEAVPYSWEETFKLIWGFLPGAFVPGTPPVYNGWPAAPTWPTFQETSLADPSAATNVPENYIFEGVPAWQAIGRLLNDLDLTICPPDVATQTWKISRLAVDPASIAALDLAVKDSADYLIDNYATAYGAATILPAFVRVMFPSQNYQYQSDDRVQEAMDFWRGSPLYSAITDEPLEPLLPAPEERPAGLQFASAQFKTVRTLLDWSCAEYGWDPEGSQYDIRNAIYLANWAKYRTVNFLRSTLYGELPARFVFSGLPPGIASNQETSYRAPNGRWSAIYYYDHGHGLRTELLRYPRVCPSTLNLSIGNPLTNGGGGSAPPWAPWATATPGSVIGSQGMAFSSSEIGAAPSLSRPGSSPTVTPHDRWAVVKADETILPGKDGQATVQYITPNEEEETTNVEQFYLPDAPLEGEETPPNVPDRLLKPVKPITIWNGLTKPATNDSVGVVKWHWQSSTWVLISVIANGELLAVGIVESDLSKATISDPKHAWLQDKHVNITALCDGWTLEAGQKVLLRHISGPDWQVIQLCQEAGSTLDVVTNVECEEGAVDPETGETTNRLKITTESVTVVKINSDEPAP